jgi:hypothetical protein
MNSHKTGAAFLDRIIRVGRFSALKFLQRAIVTLSGSLFFGFTAAILLVRPQVALAQTETVLYSFCAMSNCADGSVPVGNLIVDATGNLYGMTGSGGIGARVWVVA